MAIRSKQAVQILERKFPVIGLQRRLASLPAQVVDDLVLEYAHQPGAKRRLPRETLRALNCREQGLLHRILGSGVVAQLKHGEFDKIGAMLLDFNGLRQNIGPVQLITVGDTVDR